MHFKTCQPWNTCTLGGNALLDLAFLQSVSTSLCYLDLSHNGLDAVHIDLLATLTGLTMLDLRANHLQKFALEVMSTLSNLTTVDLSANKLSELPAAASNHRMQLLPTLRVLNLSENRLHKMDGLSRVRLPGLRKMDVSYNDLTTLDPEWFISMPALEYLSISGNAFHDLAAGVFQGCTGLRHLEAISLHNLSYIHRDSFKGLHNLQVLNLRDASSLGFVHPYALWDLSSLETLDLSYSKLPSLHEQTFRNITSLHSLALHHIPWSCDCELTWLHARLVDNDTNSIFAQPDNVTCSSPPAFSGDPILSVPTANLSCNIPLITHHTQGVQFKIGSKAILDCTVEGKPKPEITWITPRGVRLMHKPAFMDLSLAEPDHINYHRGHHWHDANFYLEDIAHDARVHLLRNGSLYVDYVQRGDGGLYACLAQNHLGNDSAIIHFKLDYSIIQLTSSTSIWVGFSSAGIFFIITVFISAIRYAAFFGSQKEREKRQSIRNVLERMTVYKSAQIDRLSAYKTAKIDQFSAKMDKISAFKSAKVDKLRTYKQMTVASAIQHMERLREHYSSQMNRIKENCSQQVEKVRENYTTHLSKFQHYKSHQVDKIRENYNNQLLKVREYGSCRMEKLREQYKIQQQHVLKLLELLDVGNCMTVIEAECMRTESMLFDPDITFDLEAHPVHILRDWDTASEDEDADDEYVTAGSNSEAGSVAGLQAEDQSGSSPKGPTLVTLQANPALTLPASVSTHKETSSAEGSPATGRQRTRPKKLRRKRPPEQTGTTPDQGQNRSEHQDNSQGQNTSYSKPESELLAVSAQGAGPPILDNAVAGHTISEHRSAVESHDLTAQGTTSGPQQFPGDNYKISSLDGMRESNV